MINRFRNWVVHSANSKHAEQVLAVVSFVESSFFPIPTEVALIPMTVANNKKWFRYALNATIFSVLGGLFGYIIGAGLLSLVGKPIIDFYNLHDEVAKVVGLYNTNAWWAIFFGAFTPVPYKVFTITAGIAKVNVLVFVLASFFGRFSRYLIETFLIKKFGDVSGGRLHAHFNKLSLLIGVLLVVILYLLIR